MVTDFSTAPSGMDPAKTSALLQLSFTISAEPTSSPAGDCPVARKSFCSVAETADAVDTLPNGISVSRPSRGGGDRAGDTAGEGGRRLVFFSAGERSFALVPAERAGEEPGKINFQFTAFN